MDLCKAGGPKFWETVTEFVGEIKALDPSPLRAEYARMLWAAARNRRSPLILRSSVMQQDHIRRDLPRIYSSNSFSRI